MSVGVGLEGWRGAGRASARGSARAAGCMVVVALEPPLRDMRFMNELSSPRVVAFCGCAASACTFKEAHTGR
jgi:hypothetical protein